MSVQTQAHSTTSQVPSKEGLPIDLEVAILYRVDPERVVEIYKNVGVNYAAVILHPQFRSAVRQVTSKYDAKGLYTAADRAKMSVEMTEEVRRQVGARGIIVEETPLKTIVLPKRLTDAIEDKLAAEQESQRMEFVLEKERLEATRKQIEANGIAAFQRTVSEGVSENLLRWKGIEATEKLAASPNTKIVIVGGKDGMPLIMNPPK